MQCTRRAYEPFRAGCQPRRGAARRAAYVEFDTGPGPVKLGLYERKALAKDAGVAPDGTGSHRIAISTEAGPFTDPDGFAWEGAAS